MKRRKPIGKARRPKKRRKLGVYRPYSKTARILDRAMKHIKSVDYQVSARWVFYRLLQEGIYNSKRDYARFVMLTARARKHWYKKWTPETLSDETRNMDIFSAEGESPRPDIGGLVADETDTARDMLKWHREQSDNYQHDFEYMVDQNYYQKTLVVIMFEARAMHQQFRRYAPGLTLCPFGGQPSIPYKWKIAKYMERCCAYYGKDAVVLYFGDLDDAGLTIFETGKTDISKWCLGKNSKDIILIS